MPEAGKEAFKGWEHTMHLHALSFLLRARGKRGKRPPNTPRRHPQDPVALPSHGRQKDRATQGDACGQPWPHTRRSTHARHRSPGTPALPAAPPGTAAAAAVAAAGGCGEAPKSWSRGSSKALGGEERLRAPSARHLCLLAGMSYPSHAGPAHRGRGSRALASGTGGCQALPAPQLQPQSPQMLPGGAG